MPVITSSESIQESNKSVDDEHTPLIPAHSSTERKKPHSLQFRRWFFLTKSVPISEELFREIEQLIPVHFSDYSHPGLLGISDDEVADFSNGKEVSENVKTILSDQTALRYAFLRCAVDAVEGEEEEEVVMGVVEGKKKS